ATAARLGSPAWTAWIRADWADALAARGDPRAPELRVLALADAERLGMPGLVERCRGVARPVVRETANLAIAREGELWHITAFGERIHLKDSRGMQMIARLV